MQLKLSLELGNEIGEDKLRSIGVEYASRSYAKSFSVDLAQLRTKQIADLRGWLEALPNVAGSKILIRDIDTWNKALLDAGSQHARTVEHFSALITEYLRKVAGHRIYERIDSEGTAHLAYYVNEVIYHPESGSGDRYYPPKAELKTMHYELGGRKEESIIFRSEDITKMSASEALAKMGYFAETPALRKAYLREEKRFNEIATLLGKQFLANGYGTSNLDGNPNEKQYFGGKYELSNAKVVMDVFYENEGRGNNRDGQINQSFWAKKTPKTLIADDDNEVLSEDAATERGDQPTESSIEVPVHTFCAVFDLGRHLRLRVHVNYLTEYVYDKKMGEKLILNQETKDLLATLIDQSRNGFEDIIGGKGKGACVLLGGEAGLGKTLTAEVFAEANEKPLYAIQAAQLGIRSDEIEKNLAQFLARGSRWNAIVLINEADVYIRRRDRDMEHNAVVAAFLRILDYQTAILFMTTNLPDEVDGAIISRCLARILYKYPTKEQQRDIWRILADLNNIVMSDNDIKRTVDIHPNLAGRDILQLLKLALMHIRKEGRSDVSPALIDFVAQFQPTIKEVHDEHGQSNAR